MHWFTTHTMWLARPLAGRRWFPLWGVVNAIGRRSGRPYATPVVVIPTDDGFVIPLPFGDETAWARNVMAAGGARIRWNGRDHEVVAPSVIDLSVPGADAPFNRFERAAMRPLGIRAALRVVRAV
jgi:deazaflavin-dependent oxidoreductase (nitroreductase family)